MKKYILILSILIGFLLNNVHGQIFKAQIIGGINATQVDGDEVYGFHKAGGNLGLGVMFPIVKNKRLLVSLETIYNQKGASEKKSAVDTFSGNYKYRLFLDYVEAPVMIHYEDKGGWTFGLGFSWGRLVGLKEYENGVRVDSATTTSTVYAHSDWNFLADVRFRIYKQLKFNFRYAYSIVPIRERYYSKSSAFVTPHWRSQYNSMLTFRLIYVINERQTEQRKPRAQATQ